MMRMQWANGGSIWRDFWLDSFGSTFGTHYVGIKIWIISFFLWSPLTCGIVFCQAQTGLGSSLREWNIWDWYLQEESVITMTLYRISNFYRRSRHTRTTVSKNLDRSAKKCGNENERPSGATTFWAFKTTRLPVKNYKRSQKCQLWCTALSHYC